MEKRTGVCAAVRHPRCYDSYEALAADPEVEAIYIATPTLHYENCKLCLEQNNMFLLRKALYHQPGAGTGAVPAAGKASFSWSIKIGCCSCDRLREILAAGTIGSQTDHLSVQLCASGARKDRKV